MYVKNIPREVYRKHFSTKRHYPYNYQYGNGLDSSPFIGSRNQKGYGLGGILKGLFKTIIPLVKPVLKTAVKGVGRRALKGGIKVAKNVIKGGNLKQALKREAQEALTDMGKEALSHVTKKIKRNKTSPKKIRNTTRRSDIFN